MTTEMTAIQREVMRNFRQKNKILERARAQANAVGPKRGEELFEGTSYPRKWQDYHGQDDAKEYIQASIFAAKRRKARLEHTLIATGFHGIGKSALARLIAADMDVGMVEVQGEMNVSEALKILMSMQDGDILFYDEVHLAISKSRAKAEWLLPFLQDGVIVTAKGVQQVPDVTVVAATTDVQKLPETIISRFVVKPVMEEYTLEQAEVIAFTTGKRMFDEARIPHPSHKTALSLAHAGNCNPRAITALLRTLRDAALSGKSKGVTDKDGGATYDLSIVFKWTDTTPDGLDRTAKNYLLVLAEDGTASERTIAQKLNEPTPPRHTEKLLLQRGWITMSSRGREITADGLARVKALIEEE